MIYGGLEGFIWGSDVLWGLEGVFKGFSRGFEWFRVVYRCLEGVREGFSRVFMESEGM